MKAQQIKIALAGLMAVAVLWFGWSTYKFFFQDWKNYKTLPDPRELRDQFNKEFASRNPGADTRKTTLRDYQVLASLNVTGMVDEPKPTTQATAPKPQEPTDGIYKYLKVRYIQIDSEGAKKSLAGVEYTDARLSAGGEKEAVLYVGDHLPGMFSKYYLADVAPDQVIFKYDGEGRADEGVPVEDYDLIAGLVANANGASDFPAQTRKTSSDYQTPQTTVAAPDNPDEIWVGTESYADFQTNYQTILRDVGFSTVYDHQGKARGLQITKIPEKVQQNYAPGVQRGDVLKSINGHPVTSREEAINYVKQNPDLPKYVVVIERLGREITKTIVPPRR